MSGVEINPGVWINPDRIDQITEDINMDEWNKAYIEFCMARRAYRAAVENAPDKDVRMLDLDQPDTNDYKQVKVLMASGRIYWRKTDLRSTLYAVGWL